MAALRSASQQILARVSAGTSPEEASSWASCPCRRRQAMPPVDGFDRCSARFAPHATTPCTFAAFALMSTSTTGGTITDVGVNFRVRQLLANAPGDKPDTYDELVYEVAERVARAGSAGKLDLGGLIAWKRLQANTPRVLKLMSTPESVGREHTTEAFKAARDMSVPTPEAAAAARRALSPLPYFKIGDAIASAVCFAMAPDRLAVYDVRAQLGLERLGLVLTSRGGRYGRYMTLLGQLQGELALSGHDWSARQIDLALFALGGKSH
jgi:hypothetical protein